ncbi:MAG: hypothetical protein AAGK04_03425 [Planctomycetota bacterium]
MRKLRLRVYAVLAAVALAGFAIVSWTAAPVIPVVFGAVAVVAVCVNTMTSKLRTEVCWACGESVRDVPIGTYGRICPGCGAVTEPNTRLADAIKPSEIDPSDIHHA